MSALVKSPRSPVQAVPLRERPVCTVAEACLLSTLSRSSLNTLIRNGVIASSRIGTRRLVSVEPGLALRVPKGLQLAKKTGVMVVDRVQLHLVEEGSELLQGLEVHKVYVFGHGGKAISLCRFTYPVVRAQGPL